MSDIWTYTPWLWFFSTYGKNPATKNEIGGLVINKVDSDAEKYVSDEKKKNAFKEFWESLLTPGLSLLNEVKNEYKDAKGIYNKDLTNPHSYLLKWITAGANALGASIDAIKPGSVKQEDSIEEARKETGGEKGLSDINKQSVSKVKKNERFRSIFSRSTKRLWHY